MILRDAGDADLFRVRPDDPEYVAMARAEAAFWDGTPGIYDAADAMAPDQVQAHCNRRITGDENVRWFQSLGRYGQFRNGLILGAGGDVRSAYLLETNPSLNLTVCDISTGTLARELRALESRFPGRVATREADFNFLELPPDTYDLIVSASAIHHVVNLEHVAFAVNRALTADGHFFLYDYVGESRRRFTPTKKLVYELVYNRELVRQGRLPSSLVWSDGDDKSSPFCGIRSADILGVFRERLREVEVRKVGALWYPLVFARDIRPLPPPSLRWQLMGFGPIPKIRRAIQRRRGPTSKTWLFSPEFLRDLMETGDRLTDAGVLLPSNAFAIYRKAKG